MVVRLASGDQQAMAELYDATRSQVFGLAVRILDDPSSAEDVVIEVFSQCWRRASTYDSTKGNVMAWLLNMTRSRAIDAVRARRRHANTEPLDAAACAIRSDEPDPSDVSICAEQRRLVRSALMTLSEQQRHAIELAFYKGLTHAQIAAQLGQPLGTVKTRIRDGMMKLRQALTPLADTPLRQQA